MAAEETAGAQVTPIAGHTDTLTVTGPKVKKLLTQPLAVGESLRVASHSADLEIVRQYTSGGRMTVKSFRLSFPYERKQPTKWKTCGQLAQEIDAWLVARADEEAAYRAKRRAEEAEKQRKADARAALATEAPTEEVDGEPIVRIPIGDGWLAFGPNEDGTGWTIDPWKGQMRKPLTTAQVLDLLARVTR